MSDFTITLTPEQVTELHTALNSYETDLSYDTGEDARRSESIVASIREAIDIGSTQIALIWSVEDVLDKCPTLTHLEAINVLQAIKKGHDCELGVTWETIDDMISTMYHDKYEAYQNEDPDDDEEDLEDDED